MSLTHSLKNMLPIAALALTMAAGCSDTESSFVYSSGTSGLIPEAQDGVKDLPGVKKLLDEKFGDPQNLKAWLKLPIDFGGVSSTVESSTEDDGRTVIVLADDGSALPDFAERLEFLSGKAAGEILQIADWDPDTRTAVLASKPSQDLVVGDQCSIDRGLVLQKGRSSYMRHCSHCHGTSGDGNGPTAQYMTPRPRDYRHGVFKFTSTNDMSKVSRDDLTRILKYGIPGTYMPSFLLMSDEEMHSIVEYVRFLSMRGEYERKLVTELSLDYSTKQVAQRTGDGESREKIVAELTEFLGEEMAEQSEVLGDELAEIWSASETDEAAIPREVPLVPDSLESRQRGRELYLSKTLNCADCHGIDGAGNGPQTIAFEKNPLTGELYPEAGLHDVWDNLNQPRNLQTGIYRGGRRPVDLYNRIHAGIKGSRMPSFKNTPPEDIWHLVNYILSVPFESEPGKAGGVSSGDTPAAAEASSVPSDSAAE